MQFEWTNIYWDKLLGEKHLLINPNTEHSQTTGLYTAIGSVGTFIRSVGLG